MTPGKKDARFLDDHRGERFAERPQARLPAVIEIEPIQTILERMDKRFETSKLRP